MARNVVVVIVFVVIVVGFVCNATFWCSAEELLAKDFPATGNTSAFEEVLPSKDFSAAGKAATAGKAAAAGKGAAAGKAAVADDVLDECFFAKDKPEVMDVLDAVIRNFWVKLRRFPR